MSRILSLAVTAFLLAGCAAEEPEAAPESGAATSSGEPRTLEAPAADADGVLRVLVLHDMEGLSGQSDPNTFRFGKPEYPQGREALIGDVNAVVDGLFAGGADEVHVVDGHGSGNREPDVTREGLDERATQVLRDEPFRQYVDLVEDGGYDAVAVVGMHAKTGSRGFASHTYTLGMDILFNDMPITETELVGYSFGRAGVPVIFGSGDDRLAEDLREPMPWLRFVTVKTATSASTAEPRPVEEARAELREQARLAIENRDEARAMRLTEPVRATLHAVPPARVDMLEGVPGLDYDGDASTVSFTAPDFQAAYDGVIALLRVATAGYTDVLWETIRESSDSAAIRTAYSDNLFDRWMDVESGRWSPPARQAQPEARQHHGAN